MLYTNIKVIVFAFMSSFACKVTLVQDLCRPIALHFEEEKTTHFVVKVEFKLKSKDSMNES